MSLLIHPPLNHSEKESTKKVLEQTSCPRCPSSDAFTIYQKEVHGKTVIDAWCYRCGHFSNDPYGDLERSLIETRTPGTVKGYTHKPLGDPEVLGTEVHSLNRNTIPKSVSVEDGLLHPVRALNERKLSYATCEHFGVRVGVSSTDGETPIYTLFPRYRDGELVGYKTKTPDKKFISTGGNDTELFGLNLIKPTGKKLWITEGEEDALALYQVLKEGSTLSDWEPPVLSLNNGSASAASSITRSLERLEGYEEIILVLDNDPPGKKARDEICKILAGKVSYVTLPLKDSNEMLMQGRGTELRWLALSHQKKYQPDGILNAKDLWDKYNENRDNPSYPYPEHMANLNAKTYGYRPGSIVTVTAGTGSGKTQFLREIIYNHWNITNDKIAGLFLEEDVSDTIDGLLALHLNKRIQLPDVEVSDDELRIAFDQLFGDGRISLYDYFGGMDDGSLLAKLRYFAVTGHKLIVLDHFSIVVSEYAAEGGERERIDTLMTKLAKFAKEFGIVLFIVVHLRKSDISHTSFELGAKPSLDDLRGSGSLKQLSWDVLALSRNQQHEDPYCANTTEVSVLKCRFTGRTGNAGYLHFDDHTGRLFSVEKPMNYRQKKRSNSNDEF